MAFGFCSNTLLVAGSPRGSTARAPAPPERATLLHPLLHTSVLGGDEEAADAPLLPAPARAGRVPEPLLAAAHQPPAPKHKRFRPETPASGAVPATPAPATPAPTNSQLAALGKKHAADRTAQGRAYDAALARERTRYTNLEADYGRYQVTRDAEHHTHLAVSEQLKQAGKPPCSQSA